MSASLSADAKPYSLQQHRPPTANPTANRYKNNIFSIPILMTWLQPQNPDVKEVGWGSFKPLQTDMEQNNLKESVDKYAERLSSSFTAQELAFLECF